MVAGYGVGCHKLHHAMRQVAGHFGGGSEDDAEMSGAGHGEAVITSAEEPSRGRWSGGIKGQAKTVEFGSAYDVRSRSAVDNDDRFSRWAGGEGGTGGGVAPKDNVGAVTEGDNRLPLLAQYWRKSLHTNITRN